jgi:hypothetical protein
MPRNTITVRILNMAEGNFAKEVEAPTGQTLENLLSLEGVNASGYTIRITRGDAQIPPVAAEVLHDGDLITITPTKVAGA